MIIEVALSKGKKLSTCFVRWCTDIQRRNEENVFNRLSAVPPATLCSHHANVIKKNCNITRHWFCILLLIIYSLFY